MPPFPDYTAPEGLLAGRVIFITGASAGIGRTAATTFARYGATVLLHGRNADKLAEVYDEIVAAGGPEPGIAALDLTTMTADEVIELTHAMHDQYGRLDGLLHNAGLLGERVPLENYDPNLWDKVMHVNLTTVFQLTRSFMPLLRASEDASIVLTSSGVGTKPRAYWGAYSVSKYALEGFGFLLADELGTTSNIRTNIVNPGGTRTDMRAAAYPAENPASLKTPDALMPLYLYLMGPDSKGVNGERFEPA